MSAIHWLLALACVVIISFGQVLFRLVGLEVEAGGSWLRVRTLLMAALAMALYAGASLLWIQILRTVTLARVYPVMAFSFVLVPLLCRVLLREGLHVGYYAGAVLIAAGVSITFLSR